MEDIINVLKDYWQLILASVVFILSFILQLIKKKPINDIFSFIYEAAIDAIHDSECNQYVVFEGEVIKVSGESKKERAINYVKHLLMKAFPDIKVSDYTNIISDVIETILTTPQKKGGNADGEKKTHD